jgi:transcriptional regulator with XRE-family HTH domain
MKTVLVYSNFMYVHENSTRAQTNFGLTILGMPRKITPSSAFGKRLVQLRMERNLTQADLATLIGSTQRNVSHYETVAEYPPTDVLVKIAAILKVSTDDLLGLRPPPQPARAKQDPETKRLWKRFQQLISLPEKDQRAVIRLINSLVSTRHIRDNDDESESKAA